MRSCIMQYCIYLIWMSDELMAKYWHMAYNVKNNKICKAFLSSLFLVRYVCMYVFSCPNDVQWNDFNILSLLSMTASEQNVIHNNCFIVTVFDISSGNCLACLQTMSSLIALSIIIQHLYGWSEQTVQVRLHYDGIDKNSTTKPHPEHHNHNIIWAWSTYLQKQLNLVQ